jgi:hypothetical protein
MYLIILYPNNHLSIQQSKIFSLFNNNSYLYDRFSVIEQVQNPKLTTFSLDYLNKLFAETEIQVEKYYFKYKKGSLCLL